MQYTNISDAFARLGTSEKKKGLLQAPLATPEDVGSEYAQVRRNIEL